MVDNEQHSQSADSRHFELWITDRSTRSYDDANERAWSLINSFTADPVKALRCAILVSTTIFNFWHSGTLALSPERQSAQMSKIENGGLDQHGAGPFEQQQYGTAGVEGVKQQVTCYCLQWSQPSDLTNY